MPAQPQTDLVRQVPQGDLSAALLESVLISGDLAKLPPSDRIEYYRAVCQSIGLNPLTKPFEYIALNGRLTLYAKKDCTDQLRQRDGVSINIVAREIIDDIITVTARAKNPSGREDESIGAVSIGSLKGEAKANAFMKAETKAKRRVTLSICGLGMLDESEVSSVSDARQVVVDHATGEIKAEEIRSKAAQEEIAKQYEAEHGPAYAESKEKAKRSSKAPRDDWFKEMLAGFAEIKKRIGEADYYRILGGAGYERSNQIPSRDIAKSIYAEMFALEQERLRAQRQEAPVQDAFDDHMAQGGEYPG